MEQLRKDGWYINESQVSEFFTDGILPKTSNEILKTILDEDLRSFGEASIINLHRKEDKSFEGPCVLQLLRYRNVSVPRIKEEMNQADPAHSVIRLFFTDGHTSISALVLENIPGINSETPPGTKILFTGKIPTEGIFLVVNKKNVKVLGGKVGPMIEKWRFEKNSVRSEGYHAKKAASKGTGAPKWVSFTNRKEGNIKLDKSFKANDAMPKGSNQGDEEDEFMKNREEALKEFRHVSFKTFYTPNVERPAPKEKVAPVPKEPKEPKPRKQFKKRGRKNSEDGPDVDVGEYANHRPSGPATLFDFIGGGAKEASTSSEKNDLVKLVEETSRMQVSGGQSSSGPAPGSQKSFGRGRGGGGARGEQREQRNDFGKGRGGPNPRQPYGARRGGHEQRPAKNYEGRQVQESAPARQESFRKPFNQQGGNFGNTRPNTGPPQQSTGKFNRNDRPNTGPSQQASEKPRQNDHRQGGGRQSAPQLPQQAPSGKFNNNDRSNDASVREPVQGQGRFSQRGNSGNQNQNQNEYQQPHQPKQGNFQRNTTAPSGPRGNQQRKDLQRDPPRGGNPNGSYQNQNRQSAAGPALNRNDFPPVQSSFGGSSSSHGPQWRVGSQCLSTWTDGNLYPATVTAVLPDGNCVIRYNEYGNTQTIPADFLIIP